MLDDVCIRVQNRDIPVPKQSRFPGSLVSQKEPENNFSPGFVGVFESFILIRQFTVSISH